MDQYFDADVLDETHTVPLQPVDSHECTTGKGKIDQLQPREPRSCLCITMPCKKNEIHIIQPSVPIHTVQLRAGNYKKKKGNPSDD